MYLKLETTMDNKNKKKKPQQIANKDIFIAAWVVMPRPQQLATT